MMDVVAQALANHPRVRLAHLPTPLEAMENLSERLGGPRLFVKRDDCTGVAMGGNKSRQAEFYFGRAVEAGADTVVTTGAFQSNHARMCCAYARKLGMACEIQLEHRVAGKGDTYLKSGNVLLDRLLGAVIHEYPDGEDEAGADRNLSKIAEAIAERGGKPYVIPLSADHPPVGALGYVEAAAELVAQAEAMGISIDTVVVPSGSASTHAGMLAGMKAMGSPVRVLGICVRRDAAAQGPRVLKRTRETLELAGLSTEVTDTDVHVTDAWLGDGYGRLNDAAREAMTLAAECEGLLLDPVYTAKSLAGLIGAVRDGTIGAEETVVFLHTGGTPALFAYEEFLGH
ncbi:MAG: D-cysteine desulfhydrase family protein [Rhodospirillaceae bacterium]|nr:D-cysteine desulfhydrase family protein [Rhodospirillaceae bacterium]MDD9917691.1 D-cysteine desulfhydrase family protein [Rhodospirillaceae bacterium]MDD9927700.1 D-cysteine desulfhydrase family protein [Rhodospirillaceae bacterium]